MGLGGSKSTLAKTLARVHWISVLNILDFLLLPFISENGAAVDDEAVGRDAVVQLQSLLR